MRNRQVVDLLLYPKYFLSLAIPYKGKYLVRMRVYQKKVLNNKITHAYPRMSEFQDNKSTKQHQCGKVNISSEDVFFDTESFFLHYSNQKVILNTYCHFRLEYDELRQFKTFIELQLIRKSDSNVAEEGCISVSKDSVGDEPICKETYIVNNLKRLDILERVSFQHYDFYCALDLYIATVSLGRVYRNYKFQLVQFSINQNQTKRSKSENIRYAPSLAQLISSINQQLTEYHELRKILLKYQQLIKVKKSFLFQSAESFLETFQDLSYIKYNYNEYEKRHLPQAITELQQDIKLINQNIQNLLKKLPRLIKDMPPAAFKNLIAENVKRKFELKKKYLLKKVTHNVILNQTTQITNASNPRLSFDNTNQCMSEEILRTSYTFKQNRKMEKQEFIHIRRQQFIRAFHLISLKECNFPMMLIEKSVVDVSHHNKEQIKGQQACTNLQDSSQEGVSLIILIHGYQGSHHDLKKLKNYLQYLSPHLKILSITSIQKYFTEGIEFLAEKIAAQIQFYITNSYQNILKINFIGFSLGGVLARACLKHLSKYNSKMKLLITLASPHLGVSESQNTLVNLGIWYLSKIDKVKNIKELNFQSVTEQDSFLMKLSKQEEISWFNKVVIVSSSQDQFVPHYSARIIGDTKNKDINSLAHNIMSRIQSYDRIEVWFDVEKKSSIDKMIGRKSHIQFIDNYSFLEMLCTIYQKQF